MDCHENPLPHNRYDDELRTQWDSEPLAIGVTGDFKAYTQMVNEGFKPEFPVDDSRSQRASEQNQRQYGVMLDEERNALLRELQIDYRNDEAATALGALAREIGRADFPMHWDDDA